MTDSPDVEYFTVTSPSQVKGRKPCGCGCGGKRHRVKVEMEEWAEEGANGKLRVPVYWATKLSALGRAQFKASLETFDEEKRVWYINSEWQDFHWLAMCLNDHQEHRIWEDLAEARQQLGDMDGEDIAKLVAACDAAQATPRAEGNGAAPSSKTRSGKRSGTSPSEPDIPARIAS